MTSSWHKLATWDTFQSVAYFTNMGVHYVQDYVKTRQNRMMIVWYCNKLLLLHLDIPKREESISHIDISDKYMAWNGDDYLTDWVLVLLWIIGRHIFCKYINQIKHCSYSSALALFFALSEPYCTPSNLFEPSEKTSGSTLLQTLSIAQLKWTRENDGFCVVFLVCYCVIKLLCTQAMKYE